MMIATVLECMTLAQEAKRNRARCVAYIATLPIKDREYLLARVEELLRHPLKLKSTKIGLLRSLIPVLKDSLVHKTPASEAEEKKRALVAEEDRRKLAQITKRHPRALVIGGAQVQEFNAPRSDIVWATEKKRRG